MSRGNTPTQKRIDGHVERAKRDLTALFKSPTVKPCGFAGCKRLSLRERCEVHRR